MAEKAVGNPSSRRVILGFVVVALVVGGVFYWVNSTVQKPSGTLSVYEENCGIAYLSPSFPNMGSICTVLGPVNLPALFNLSTIIHNPSGNATTLHDVYFGVYLQAGHAIKASMSSSAPIRFYVWFDNRTGFDTRALANEVAYYSHLMTNQTGIKSYNNRLLAQESGWQIFELSVNQPNPIPNVSFDILAND